LSVFLYGFAEIIFFALLGAVFVGTVLWAVRYIFGFVFGRL